MRRFFIFALLALATLALPLATGAKDAKKAGNISALEALQLLKQYPKGTFLIDVRTRAEYVLLGHPPQAYNVPWRFATNDFQVKGAPYHGSKAPVTGYQLSPQPNPDFVEVVQSLFKPGDRLIIISTQGNQGAEAADALVQAGFKKVFNIRHGFMGEVLTSKEHAKLAETLSPYFGLRGRVNGWVYWGLPVSRRVDPRYIYPPDLKRMQSFK